MGQSTRAIPVESLLVVVTRIFQACGATDDEAQIVAEHLVDAEGCGVTSHGLIRVPQYVRAVQDGQVIPGAKLSVVSQTVSAAVLDGGRGFGQVMARRAMDVALELAGRTGVGAVTLSHCSHTGRLGSYTEQAARRGMIGMMMVNAGGLGQWVAPYGGTDGRLATNPLSIAVPTDSGDPLLLDIATSVAPEGRVRTMKAAGKALPEGWAINHRGEPTTDPGDLYGPPRGALLPFGGHKGFGLAMIVDALAGGLSGAGCCCDPEAPTASGTDGVFMVAVQIQAFCPLPEFGRTVMRLARHVKSSPPADGFAEVLAPGELEARARRRRLDTGIEVEPAVLQMIRQVVHELGVSCEPVWE